MTTYGHHETCGICHTSGPCRHTMDALSKAIEANEKAPRVVKDIKVEISAPTKYMSFEIDQDTITWYKLLDETTQEVVSSMQQEIEAKVVKSLQDKCQKRNGHSSDLPHVQKQGASANGSCTSHWMVCQKCGYGYWHD
jgi:hypothetical protein